jgi:alkylation response protein AidB-like acyl-CoA dehydrogenase
MDVRLSSEQRALRDSAVRLVDRLGPGSVLDLDDSERTAKLDAAVAASGWRELRCADDDGAPWASAVETAIVAEELGRGLADTSYVGPTLAAELRRLAGATAAEVTETVGMSGDLGALAADPGGVAIDAAGADVALVLTGDGAALGAVRLPEPAEAGADLTQLTSPISTAAESIEPAAPLSDEALMRWTALGLALTAADLVGVMRGTIKLASDYAGVRQQYGALIGSFQAVQHLLADAFVSMEGSRSYALHAAWAVDALPPDDALAAAAAAKAYCARAARAVCEASIQVHGGIGNTWECLAHVYLRRAIVSSDLFGGVGVNLDRVMNHQKMGPADGVR